VLGRQRSAVTPARRQVLGHGSTGNEHGRRKGVEESVHLIVTNTGNDSQEQSSFFRKEHRLDCYGIPMSTWVENFCHNLQRSMHEFFSAFLGEKTKETEPVHQGSLRGSSAVSSQWRKTNQYATILDRGQNSFSVSKRKKKIHPVIPLGQGHQTR